MDGRAAAKRMDTHNYTHASPCGEEKITQVSLLGQGDNQMVIVKVPSEEELHNRGTDKDHYINDYKVSMAAMAEKCGLIIKAEESWQSEKLVE